MRRHYLQEIVARQKQGVPAGIFSVCSAHPLVVRAGVERARRDGTHVLIEATSNQVNQFGGYTGMQPVDFRRFVLAAAAKEGLSEDRVILGGDHLGPNPWQGEPAAAAMAKGCEMVQRYVRAGFTKIHLDASMYLGDDQGDRTRRLETEIVAERTAALCRAAEEAFAERRGDLPDAAAPVYVIGSEVPVPGGVQSDDEALHVTAVEDFRRTVTTIEALFAERGLQDAWERVVGVVVQPGVEFGDEEIHDYDRSKAAPLSHALKSYDRLVFEGHSTDYQRPERLREMVEDGVAILKVGPALTFAMREALFLLSCIEAELIDDRRRAHLPERLEQAMLSDPSHWEKYYRGDARKQRLSRKYSFSDRSRYYWTKPRVQEGVEQLFTNLRDSGIPLSILSQFLPVAYERVRRDELSADPEGLVVARVDRVLGEYAWAVDSERT